MKNTVIGDSTPTTRSPATRLRPNDSSAQELAAIKTNKGTSKEPDVVDVSPAIAVLGESYFQPYKVQTWNDIPNSMKDPAGRWYGDYYGVISFGTNTSVVKNPPKSWADLKSRSTRARSPSTETLAAPATPLPLSSAQPSRWAARSTTSCRASSTSST